MHTIEAALASALILTSLYFLITYGASLSSPNDEVIREQLRDYGVSSLNALEVNYGVNESSMSFLQRSILKWDDGGKEELEEALRSLLPENIRFDVVLIFRDVGGELRILEEIDGGVPRDAVIVESTIFLRDDVVESPLVLGGYEVHNLEGEFHSSIILRLVLWYA